VCVEPGFSEFHGHAITAKKYIKKGILEVPEAENAYYE
jgi:hypothetical protein